MPLYRQRVIEDRQVEVYYLVQTALPQDVQEVLAGDDSLGEIISDSNERPLSTSIQNREPIGDPELITDEQSVKPDERDEPDDNPGDSRQAQEQRNIMTFTPMYNFGPNSEGKIIQLSLEEILEIGNPIDPHSDEELEYQGWDGKITCTLVEQIDLIPNADPKPSLNATVEFRDFITIRVDGYGNATTDPGEGHIIDLELYSGRPQLHFYPDINNQEPSTVYFNRAHESCRLLTLADFKLSAEQLELFKGEAAGRGTGAGFPTSVDTAISRDNWRHIAETLAGKAWRLQELYKQRDLHTRPDAHHYLGIATKIMHRLDLCQSNTAVVDGNSNKE